MQEKHNNENSSQKEGKRISIPIIYENFVEFTDEEIDVEITDEIENNRKEIMEDDDTSQDGNLTTSSELSETLSESNEESVKETSEEKIKKSWIRNKITRLDDKYVSCNNCKKKLSFPVKNGKITNLHKHKCFKVEKLLHINKEKRKIHPLPEEEQRGITFLLLKLLVSDQRPFRLIATDKFKDFIYALNSRYIIPSYNSISKMLKNK